MHYNCPWRGSVACRVFISEPTVDTELSTGHCVCYVWFLVRVSMPCLEKEDETLARGGIEVILKTGYQDGKCWKDKACRESSEYTETGNRLLVLLMQRRWKTAWAWIFAGSIEGQRTAVDRCLLISIRKSGLFPSYFECTSGERQQSFPPWLIPKWVGSGVLQRCSAFVQFCHKISHWRV